MCQPVQRFGVPIHCLSQAKSQVIASRFSILIRVASVLPFEYGDSDWRVAIKLIYRNMVQESRYNHCCHHKAHPPTWIQGGRSCATAARSESSPKGRTPNIHSFVTIYMLFERF